MFTVQTEWDCPEEFPDLSGAKYIAIDLETKDPDLKSINCGNINGKNNQAFGLVPATKKPSLKKEKKLFEEITSELIFFGAVL